MSDSLATWTLRLVLSDGGGPAPAVPVTLLDDQGNAAGQWLSDTGGRVRLPRLAAEQVRLRVGLRSEQPVTLDAAALDAGEVEVAAPPTALPAVVERDAAPRSRQGSPFERGESPGHLLVFSRLLVAPHEQGTTDGAVALTGPVDFFEPTETNGAEPRYGVLLEMEQYWEPAGHAAGDLLFTTHVLPGEELRIVIDDRRWTAVEPQRPIEAAASLMSDPSALDGVRGDGARALEPLALVPASDGAFHLAPAVAETAALVAERAVRAGHALRRRPLGVHAVAAGVEPAFAVARTLRNPYGDRTIAYHFYEALARYRVFSRPVRLRPVILVPFRLPALGTRVAIRQYGPVLRRALLDPALRPDLERLLADEPTGPVSDTPPVSELRLVAQVGPERRGTDLRRTWCFLRVDQTRYTVHFFPTDTPPRGASTPERTGAKYWVGAVRLSDFHQNPLQFPGRIALQNASVASVTFEALHLEGRAADRWLRLHSLRGVVVQPHSQIQLSSLAELADAPGLDPGETRLLSHVTGSLAHYSAAIIAGGDPGLRLAALAKVRDARGHSLASVISNNVVGAVGTRVAFPLRSADYVASPLRAALVGYYGRTPRMGEEALAALPLPGVWMATQVGEGWVPAQAARDYETGEEGAPLRGRRWR